jgi:hypothetical protein
LAVPITRDQLLKLHVTKIHTHYPDKRALYNAFGLTLSDG